MKRIYVIFFILTFFILYKLEFDYNFFNRIFIHNQDIDKKNLKKVNIIKKIVLQNTFKNIYYNPSIFFYNGYFYIIKRNYKLHHFISKNLFNINTVKNDKQNVSKIEKRDKDFKFIKDDNLYANISTCINKNIFKIYKSQQYIEDIKILKIDENKILISYTILDPDIRMGIGYIELENKEINHLITITKSNGKEITSPEKNWQLVTDLSENVLKILSEYNYNKNTYLLMLTYASPQWLISIIDIKEGNKIDIPEFTYNLGEKLIKMKWPEVSSDKKTKKKVQIESNLRCSTSLEIINEKYYITVLHTYNPHSSVFCLVDINTLEPMYLYGPVKFKNYKCIEFPSSLKIINNLIYLGLGISDSESEIYLIDKEYLLNLILNNKNEI